MTPVAAIQAELKEITTHLTDAADQIQAGITLDLSDMAPRASVLCEQILQLPPEQALSMLIELNEAVTKLDFLTDKIKS